MRLGRIWRIKQIEEGGQLVFSESYTCVANTICRFISLTCKKVCSYMWVLNVFHDQNLVERHFRTPFGQPLQLKVSDITTHVVRWLGSIIKLSLKTCACHRFIRPRQKGKLLSLFHLDMPRYLAYNYSKLILIFFYKFNCTDPGLQLGDPAPLIGLLMWTCWRFIYFITVALVSFLKLLDHCTNYYYSGIYFLYSSY